MTDTQKKRQLEEARQAAYRRGDDEGEAWYAKELEQLDKKDVDPTD